MPKVLCTRPNASEEISGVKFEPVEGGMLSEEISDEQAAAFTVIPGYELQAGKVTKPPADDADKDALLARAAAVGLAVKGNWGIDRLRKEVDDAEAKANAGSGA